MGKLLEFTGDFKRRRLIRAAEMYAAGEPSDEMVWEVCIYTRGTGKNECSGCPRLEHDPDHGDFQRMCYGLAAEACRVVFAMQKREAAHGPL